MMMGASTRDGTPGPSRDKDIFVFTEKKRCSRNIKTTEKLPGVLVIHAFAGCSEFEMEKAEQLAKVFS